MRHARSAVLCLAACLAERDNCGLCAERANCRRRTRAGRPIFPTFARPPARELALGSGLTVCLEPSGMKTFQARIRRQGERNPRRVRIGIFRQFRVAEARRKLIEMKSIAREGRDPALEQRRARAGVSRSARSATSSANISRAATARSRQRRSRSSATCLRASWRRRSAIGCSPILSQSTSARPLRTTRPAQAGRAIGGNERQQAPGGRQAHVQDRARLGHRRFR